MEILNCEYENKKIKIVTSTKNLSDIVTTIKENFWNFVDDSEKIFIIENMKLYEDTISNVPKNIRKNIIKNNKRAELIRNIFYGISPESSHKFKYAKNNKKKIKIDYSCLESIVFVIQQLLKNIVERNDFPQILNEVIDNNNFSNVYDFKIWSTTLMGIKNEFNQVEEISFQLSGSDDEEFEINYILLFYYFYKVFFPKVDMININLDLIEANKKFMEMKNPYNFNDDKLRIYCQNCHNICRANFLLVSLISSSKRDLKKLNIKSTESFVNEINYIIGNEYSNGEFKGSLVKDKGLILFKTLMKIKELKQLEISIDCLDRFLFKETFNFIANYRSLESLKLNLFYNPNCFSKRKIYLNYLRGQEYYEIDPNILDKYGIVYYPYINKLGEEIGSVIEDDKILDLVFSEFKKNITNLKLLLNQYIVSYKEFSLNISPYDEINKYQNYNVQILLFIIAILASIENSKQIESLSLNCENFEYENTFQIMKNINKLITPRLIDLSKCEKLQQLVLNIQGVSLFLDFDKLPFNSLTKLEISIANKIELEKFKTFFDKHKNDFIKLEQLNITFLLVDDINYNIKELFDNLPPSLKQLNINNENIMNKDGFVELINQINKNNIPINCELYCDCFELEDIIFEGNVEELKKILSSKGDINLNNCEIIPGQEKEFNFEANKQNFKVVLN